MTRAVKLRGEFGLPRPSPRPPAPDPHPAFGAADVGRLPPGSLRLRRLDRPEHGAVG